MKAHSGHPMPAIISSAQTDDSPAKPCSISARSMWARFIIWLVLVSANRSLYANFVRGGIGPNGELLQEPPNIKNKFTGRSDYCLWQKVGILY